MKNPLESARNPDLRGSWDALLRAAKAARRTAILTNTDLIISENRRIRRIKAPGQQESASAEQRSNEMTTMIHAEIPDQLAQQAQRMVDRGWAANVDSIVAESLRRYLESHQESLTEQFLREDVEWGLRGDD
jgi:Arc/MetJ-type ribon-helix-helix transcriptional regulator